MKWTLSGVSVLPSIFRLYSSNSLEFTFPVKQSTHPKKAASSVMQEWQGHHTFQMKEMTPLVSKLQRTGSIWGYLLWWHNGSELQPYNCLPAFYFSNSTG